MILIKHNFIAGIVSAVIFLGTTIFGAIIWGTIFSGMTFSTITDLPGGWGGSRGGLLVLTGIALPCLWGFAW